MRIKIIISLLALMSSAFAFAEAETVSLTGQTSVAIYNDCVEDSSESYSKALKTFGLGRHIDIDSEMLCIRPKNLIEFYASEDINASSMTFSLSTFNTLINTHSMDLNGDYFSVSFAIGTGNALSDLSSLEINWVNAGNFSFSDVKEGICLSFAETSYLIPAGSYIAILIETTDSLNQRNDLDHDNQFYFSGNVNGAKLVATLIPEPATYAAIFGAFVLAFVIYRRRK